MTKVPFPAISIDTGDTLYGEKYFWKAISQIEFECMIKAENAVNTLDYVCSPEQLSRGIRGLFNETLNTFMFRILSEKIRRLENNPQKITQGSFFLRRKWGRLNYETISQQLMFGMEQGLVTKDQLVGTMAKICATYFGYLDIFQMVYHEQIIQKRVLTEWLAFDGNNTNVSVNESTKQTTDAILLAPFQTLMKEKQFQDISLQRILLAISMTESNPTSRNQLEFQHMWNMFNGTLSNLLFETLIESVDSLEDGAFPQAKELYDFFGCSSRAQIQYHTIWSDYNLDENKNINSSAPCEDILAQHFPLISNCCEVMTFLSKNIRPVLQVIKHSMQSPTIGQSFSEHESDFVQNTLFPNYPQIRTPNIEEKQQIKKRLQYGKPPKFSPQLSMLKNPSPRVFLCHFGAKTILPSPFECEGFYRRIGNQGLTFTYNGGKFWDHYQVTPTSTLFYEGLLSDNTNGKEQTLRYPGTRDQGNTFSMTLRLDPDFELLQQRHSQLASSFKLNLHDPYDVPDFQSSYIEIKPMYEYTINVVPFLTELSKDFENLDPSTRNCRLLSETKGLRFFEHYTQTGCIYECQINFARAKCGCTPWNVPNLHNSWRLCDFHGHHCFQYELASLDTKECNCPVNCNLGRYEYSVTALNMEPERLCRDSYDFDLFNSLVDPIYIGEKQFARTLSQLLWNKSESDLQQCLREVKRLAVVHVQLGTQTVTVAQKDVRVTVGLMLSNLGKIRIDHIIRVVRKMHKNLA